MPFSRVMGRRRGLSPMMKLLVGLLAYRSLTKGKGRLAALIGAGMGRRGGLAGLFFGGAGGAFLSSVLQHTLDNLRRHPGPLAPDELEEALGEERIRWLMARTGLSRAELLAGLRAEVEDPQV
jgi:uncharacterized protein YidB (DUF937 family)